MRNRFLWTLLLLSGCGIPDKEVAEMKRTADEKFVKAEREAKRAIEEAKQQIEQLKSELAEAKSQSEKAQASTDEQSKTVEAALDKAREAFKAAARQQLTSINKEVAEVSAKTGKVPAKAKAAFLTSMKTIVQQQKALAKDIAAFDKATLETFTTLKAQFDKDFAQLKAALKAAQAKVPRT